MNPDTSVGDAHSSGNRKLQRQKKVMLIIGHVISKKHDTLATIFISLCETPAHSHLELWRKAGVSMQHMESFSWSRTTETYFFPTPLIISSDNIV